MPTIETKRKRILYKEVFITRQSVSLQNLLTNILEKYPKASERKEIINPDDENLFRLINKFEIYKGMLFCQLVAFEPGHSQRYIQLTNDAESYEILSVTSSELAQLSKTEADKVKQKREEIIREFIDSILYFGVHKNSIIIMQSRSLTTRELETHLGWLLESLSKKMAAGETLIIRDKPKEEIFQKVMQKPIKSVSIGAPIEATNNPINGKNNFMLTGTGAETIKAILSEKWNDFVKGTNLTNCLEDANLEVKLVFTYKRKTTLSGEKVLRNIVDSSRHYPDKDVVVEMHGGSKFSGENIRLWNTINIVSYNSLIDEHDLYNKMHAWLISLLESEEIELNEET